MRRSNMYVCVVCCSTYQARLAGLMQQSETAQRNRKRKHPSLPEGSSSDGMASAAAAAAEAAARDNGDFDDAGTAKAAAAAAEELAMLRDVSVHL